MYGGINNGSAGQVLNASLAVDGGPPVFFVPSTQPAAVTTNNLIFNSGDLADGSHTLVVTAENDHTVWADYFLVKPGAASSASASPSALSNPTPHKTPTDLIILVAVGAGVLGLVVIAAFFFLRRRKRRRAPRQTAAGTSLACHPFIQLIPLQSRCPTSRPSRNLSAVSLPLRQVTRTPRCRGATHTSTRRPLRPGTRRAREICTERYRTASAG
ncbi:hypothetical protein DFH08DRAFT_237600 [Mycena albidolilacea]|uniref:Uncharacterized protein n=1 Tax=Mycena albidolilacea TaxID=1033008 RepID=A0AAD7ENK0_9AGAR|nr:hypothetical protein DFH08DRAFT_237600 [Mycena albidolilacea]